MCPVYQEEGREDVEHGEENHKDQVHHIWWPSLAFLGWCRLMVSIRIGWEGKICLHPVASLVSWVSWAKLRAESETPNRAPIFETYFVLFTLVTLYDSDDILYDCQMTRCKTPCTNRDLNPSPWLMEIILNPMSIYLYWQDKKLQWRELRSSDYSSSSTSLQLEPPWWIYICLQHKLNLD